jgi:DNA polymerase-3 subunit delta'
MNKIINEILNASVPTRLVVGTLEQIQNLAEIAIRSHFCQQKNAALPNDLSFLDSCACLECRRIKNHQHPLMVWISPEKNYSVDDVEIIFDRTKFALDVGQTFFFVIDKSSSLNAATANKLLKVLEEPPAGYKFILLAENLNSLPVTIVSRSHIIKTTDNNKHDATKHTFFKYFTEPENLPDPTVFDQELKKVEISEQECVELCYDLIEYFLKMARQNSNLEFLKKNLEILQKRLRKPPCPGSSKMFLKLLYLDFCQL